MIPQHQAPSTEHRVPSTPPAREDTSSRASEHRPTGFTLVEMMITVAIFAIGFVVIAGIYLGISTAQNRAKGSVEYLNEAQLVFEQVARLVRDNDLDQSSISCPTNCGNPNEYICLKDIANGKTFVRFEPPALGQPGRVQISRSNSCTNAVWSTLNDPSVNVQDLKFYSKFPSDTVPDEQAFTVITMRVSSNATSARGQQPLNLQTGFSSRVFVGTNQ